MMPNESRHCKTNFKWEPLPAVVAAVATHLASQELTHQIVFPTAAHVSKPSVGPTEEEHLLLDGDLLPEEYDLQKKKELFWDPQLQERQIVDRRKNKLFWSRTRRQC